jgi:hypothetical protein
MKKICLLLLLLATFLGPDVYAQSKGTLRQLKRSYGAIKYTILVSEARGGSAVPAHYIPLDYRSAVLPESCLGLINRQRKRMKLEPIFADLAVSSEPPPREFNATSLNRPLTEGEALFDAGVCRALALRITGKRASSRSRFFPGRPHTLTQEFCVRLENGNQQCTVPRGSLQLRYLSPENQVLDGEELRQFLTLDRVRVNGMNVARVQLDLQYVWPGTSGARNAVASYCGLACKNKKQCVKQAARLGEDGLRDLCNAQTDGPGDSCPVQNIPPALREASACSTYRSYIAGLRVDLRNDPILAPYDDFFETQFVPQNCCFNIQRCQDLFEPMNMCSGLGEECAPSRAIFGFSLAQSLPACQGYRPDGF